MAVDTLSLAGKVAIVTGSSRENGIGAAIARAFARNGASVAIHHVSDGSRAGAHKVAADITREFGVKATVVRGSVGKSAAAQGIVEQALAGLGVDHIDILGANTSCAAAVNNAGAGTAASLLEMTPELVDAEFSVNTFGPHYLIQAVVGVGKMPQGGRIINVGSIVSKMGLSTSAMYAAAKAAQDSLTASWAAEVSLASSMGALPIYEIESAPDMTLRHQLGHSHGITVNSLAPGPIPTDTSRKFLKESDGSPTPLQLAMQAQTRAADRLGTVEDMADAALLLVSEKSRWITAQWISVSGGINIQGPTLADSPDELAGTIWGQSVSEMDRPVFENVYGGSQAIDIMDLFNSSSDVLTADPTSLTSWTLQLTGPALFDRRPFPRPKHGPLASLVMRMLRSYPFMMLRKAALPPFIHPLLFTWAEAGAGPSQEALINCVGLVDLFKSRKGSDRDVVWKLIKLEQERIVASHSEVDRWELLASFQALLVYCLLRLQEAPAGDHGFDSGLLTAVNVIFNALSASVGGILKMKLPDDPNVSWTDWIYNESRRRTVLVFQIINIMVEWSTAASAYATCGLVLIPLANNATLWNAKNSESWRSEFTLCCKERSLMGVSQSGALTKLLLGDSGITLSTVEWEEWTAEVGDIGTLVMMVGALL
ncbi:proteasome subunit alpha [Purpureocillium lavendulum]|uniref:Proteasome subunit alpha n=1 Tax=Purpureocillium lavendulum TaxID=1247861 RepID=A0AB34FJC7_9HYPO|nr:proteasome subunit alpha [Purpureocillium lavendulum]